MSTLYLGDCLEVMAGLESESVNCCVTSPPYWGLRDYGVDGQLGLEPTPEEYVTKMVAVFAEVWRVLRDDGTLWLNLGDSYTQSGMGGNPAESEYRKQATNAGSLIPGRRSPPCLKPKNLAGIPWRVALALQADGWYLRNAIIWAKPNSMPGSQQDRCTSSYEMVFMLTKSGRYWSDFDAIKTPPRESSLMRLAQQVQMQAGSHRANGGAKTNGPMRARPGKQRGHSRRHDGFNDRWDAMSRDEQMSAPVMMRDVWFVPPACYSGAHYAVMPVEIARRCVLAGCPEGGIAIDPFAGTGTVGVVCAQWGREFVGVDLDPRSIDQARARLEAAEAQLQLAVT
jgi:DNA modification methylase